jgi:hypothetical protein
LSSFAKLWGKRCDELQVAVLQPKFPSSKTLSLSLSLAICWPLLRAFPIGSTGRWVW